VQKIRRAKLGIAAGENKWEFAFLVDWQRRYSAGVSSKSFCKLFHAFFEKTPVFFYIFKE